MKISSPKLPLTPKEKVQLKTCKIKLKEISSMDISQLSKCLHTSFERANYLRGLAQFQLIPSIGPKVAQRVIDLGYYSLEEIQNEDGADLINRLEELYGYWEDPCVEDSLSLLYIMPTIQIVKKVGLILQKSVKDIVKNTDIQLKDLS